VIPAIGLTALLVAGCATGPSDDGVVTLELWDTDTRPERTANLEKLIDMFEKENPGIKVDYLGLPTDSYMQKIGTAVATGSTPDLVTPKASDISALVAQGALAPLDDRFSAGGWQDQIDASLVQTTRDAAPDGKLYITPATALADVMFYRADWLRDAGLPEPTSWDDFDSEVAALTDASTGRFGYTIRGGNGFWPQFMEMVFTRAGIATLFDENGKSTLDDPRVVEAAQKYVDLYKTTTAESDLTADFKVMQAQFAAGSAGFLSHSIGSYPTLLQSMTPDQIGVTVPFPAEDGTQVLGLLTTGFAMFQSSKHPEEAWKFLEFTMSQEGDSFWAQASGYIPGNIAVADEQWVQDSPALAAAIAAGANEKAVPMNVPYYLPEYSSITGTDMLPDWQLVLQGELSVQDFLTKYATAMNEAQQRYEDATK